ncbi:MAG: ornithine carbamoyltransferase [Solirubrobacterales bacterium]|nr:ornithine carbamoyltransferase [Solirubrobacterales bacterium]
MPDSWPTAPAHFLTGTEPGAEGILALVDRAIELKAAPLSVRPLEGASIALIFEKPSTRTRVSFEVAVTELGGHAVVLRGDEMQLSRGESPRDTGLVLSRHVEAIAIRTHSDEVVSAIASASSVPVINMLTDGHHPCQALGDLVTLKETFGHLDGLKLAFVGDGNNVARSLALVAGLVGVQVTVASPSGYQLEPLPGLVITDDPAEAAMGADAIYADAWVSMGDEATAAQRLSALAPYCLDDALLDLGAPGAVALHCLPAHPGQEITPEVLYGSRQRIWDQAENRRHAQKALLEAIVRAV